MAIITKQGSFKEYRGAALASAVAVALINLDSSVVNIIIPKLGKIFSVSPAAVAIVAMAYMMTMCASLPFFGRLADRLGVERVFIGGYLVFGGGSLFCGLAPGFTWLAVFRGLQGIGAGMLMATSAAVVVEYVPDRFRARAFSLNGFMMSLGLAVGPPLGVWLTHLASWRLVFLINLPLVLVGLWLCRSHFRFPERGWDLRGFDFAGAGISLILLVAITFAFSETTLPRGDTIRWLSGLLILPLGMIFFWRERHAQDPVFSLALFRNRPLAAGLAATTFYLMLFMGVNFALPFFLLDGVRMSLTKTGHVFMIVPIASFLVMYLVGRGCERVGPKKVSLIGIVTITLALVFLRLLLAGGKMPSNPEIYLFMVVFGAGLGTFSIAILTLIMSHATPGNTGMLSAVKAVLPMVGGLVGIGIASASFTLALETAGHTVHDAPPPVIGASFALVLNLALCIAGLVIIFTLLAKEKNES